MAKFFLLFNNLSEFHNVLSKKKAAGRGDDASNTQLREVIALVREEPNTSVLTMANTSSAGDGLFSPNDVDINATQEVIVGGAARNPLLDFCTLSKLHGEDEASLQGLSPGSEVGGLPTASTSF